MHLNWLRGLRRGRVVCLLAVWRIGYGNCVPCFWYQRLGNQVCTGIEIELLLSIRRNLQCAKPVVLSWDIRSGYRTAPSDASHLSLHPLMNNFYYVTKLLPSIHVWLVLHVKTWSASRLLAELTNPSQSWLTGATHFRRQESQNRLPLKRLLHQLDCGPTCTHSGALSLSSSLIFSSFPYLHVPICLHFARFGSQLILRYPFYLPPSYITVLNPIPDTQDN